MLDAGWNAANTHNVTPKIHTGWYNAAWNSTPQVTVTTPMTSTLQGSATGVSAIGAGGTKVRVLRTDLLVAVWAHREMIDPATGSSFETLGINQKAYTYDSSMEIRRIIEANIFSDPELDHVSWLGMTELVDVRIKPAVFRYDNDVRLVYREAF